MKEYCQAHWPLICGCKHDYYSSNEVVNKVWWSKQCDPEEFPEAKSYSLPFAEKIARTKYGWNVIKVYLWIRMKLEGKI